MSIILSIAKSPIGNAMWAAGPEGLFAVRQDTSAGNSSTEDSVNKSTAGKSTATNGDSNLTQIAQPQQELYCCGASDDRVLVGGLPHGVAFSLDNGENWQAAWMDGVDSPVICMATDPRVEETGVVLAGASGGGLLRSKDRGASWWVCNFGLLDYTLLTIAWAPVAPDGMWPTREVVFAGTEEGVYRSPNAGLGWRRCDGAEGVFQVIAIGDDFHQTGVVLAGTEESGLWRSDDGGYTFSRVEGAPERIDALVSTKTGWLLSDESGLWSSTDALKWQQIPNTKSTLIFCPTDDGIWGGGEFGLEQLPEQVDAS